MSTEELNNPNNIKLQSIDLQQQQISKEIQQQKKQKDTDLEKFVICVDPETGIIYSQSINYDVIIIETNIPKYIKKQANEAIEELKQSIDIDSLNWLFSKEAKQYRRRKIPSYLLHKDQSEYPVYLSQSKLSFAFASVNTIKLRVDYTNIQKDQATKNGSNYQQYNQENDEQSEENNNRIPGQEDTIEIEAGLVTGADEVIKNILRELYQKGVRIDEHLIGKKYRFILQVAGMKEYIWGNHSMMQFERVRMNLRGHEHLDLVLTKKKRVDKKDKLFPPIRERKISEIKNGYIDQKTEIPWKQYKKIPMILWYPPVPLKNLYDKLENKELEKDQDESDKASNSNSDSDTEEDDSYKRKDTDIESENQSQSDSFEKPAKTPKIKDKRIIFFNQNKIQGDLVTNMRNFHSLDKSLQTELCQQQNFQIKELKKRMQDVSEQQNENWKQGQVDYNGTMGETSKKKDATKDQKKIYQSIKQIEEQRKYNHSDFLPSDSFLYSGNNDQPFKIKILGIDNVSQIFESVFIEGKKSPIYNGLIPPQYITMENEKQKQKQEDNNNTGDKNQNQDDEEVQIQKKVKKAGTKCLKFVKKNYSSFGVGPAGQQFKGQKQQKLPYGDQQFSHGVSGTAKYSEIGRNVGLDCYPYQISVEVQILHGQNLLTRYTIKESKKVAFSYRPRFYQWLSFNNLRLSQIPKEVRISFNVIISSDKYSQIIGSTSFMLFDENGRLRQGNISLNLWPFYKINNRLNCMQQFWFLEESQKDQFIDNKERKTESQRLAKFFSQLQIQLDSYELPVYYSLRDDKQMMALGQPKLTSQSGNTSEEHVTKNWNITPKTEYLAKLKTLLQYDSLSRENYTQNDKFILMICRHHYKTLKDALQIFLCAVDWSDPAQVREAHQMLKQWNPLDPEDALPLINAEFADKTVRLYAIERISTLCDEELALYMLELIQTLFFESNHFSPLGEMLLERALMNPNLVGHEFFWQIKSQLHQKSSLERFPLLIEQFLMLSGSYRKQIALEVTLNEKLSDIGQTIKTLSNLDIMKRDCKLHLKKLYDELLDEKQSFNFPLDQRMQSKSFTTEKCKVLGSKKKPLWIVNNNLYPGAQEITVMFKCGDDIRQDQLTIQLIKIMDKIWLDNGYDFRMKPYKVLATADQVGMIEVVNKSKTTCDIHEDYGGLMGAFINQTIWKFLKEKNKDPHMFEIATENFLKSCAGYCVATYILGIGDRHSDNIMLTETGHLFHIDFGHFLGNFKTKIGINRERAPFVLTQEMAFVMGGSKGKLFKKFEGYCTEAYNIVRKHGNLLINIFLLMTSAGMPELQSSKDLLYLKKQLSLELNDQQAITKFMNAIQEALNSKSRRLDNWAHAIKRVNIFSRKK